MFKKKKKTHPINNQLEPNNIKQENPKRKKRRSRHIFRLVIFLSVCALGWATYTNLKENIAKTNIKTSSFDIQSAKNIPVNPSSVDTSEIDKKYVLFKNDDVVETTKKSTEKNTHSVSKINPKTTEIMTEKIEITEQITQDEIITPVEKVSINKEESLMVTEEQIVNEQEEIAIPDVPTYLYSLKDALIFRDHFLSEKPCGDDFRKLILSDNKQPIVQEVIKSTSYFCLTTNNVYGELDTVFKKDKQNALIKYYYTQDSEWLAKIKSVAIRFIQIRNLNPVSDDIPSILDRAQNALAEKNISKTVELITVLPEYLQPEFEAFLEKAKNYADAAAALENLILSYAKGE